VTHTQSPYVEHERRLRKQVADGTLEPEFALIAAILLPDYVEAQ